MSNGGLEPQKLDSDADFGMTVNTSPSSLDVPMQKLKVGKVGVTVYDVTAAMTLATTMIMNMIR